MREPMTVTELVKTLTFECRHNGLDPDTTEVVFSYEYGDHWRTEVAAQIREIAARRIKHSDYHRMDKVIDEDKQDEEDLKDSRRAIVLS